MTTLRLPLRTLALATACLTGLGGCVVAPVGPPRYVRAAYVPAPPSPAAPMYFYPDRGQPEAVQDRDRYECYRWAVRESGFDPGMTALRSQGSQVTQGRYYPPPPPEGAEVVAGAATGAILGAAVSSPRQAGANAIIGAIFGAVIGAANSDARNRAYQDAQARNAGAAARARAPMGNFQRAMSACMQGRGYHVE